MATHGRALNLTLACEPNVHLTEPRLLLPALRLPCGSLGSHVVFPGLRADLAGLMHHRDLLGPGGVGYG